MSALSCVLWAVLAVGITAASALVYSRSLHGSFVYDDLKCVSENPVVTEFEGVLTPEVLARWWHADYWGRPVADPLSHKSWRPLTTLSFMYNYHWAGLDPHWFHVVNLCLHALNTLLVMLVAGRTMPQSVASSMRWTFAIVSGALFAVHPMHSESVSNITNRSELMSLFLQLVGFLVFAAGSSNTAWCRGLFTSIAAVPLIICAAMCKETGVMVTALCVAHELVAVGVVTQVAGVLYQWCCSRERRRSASKSTKKQKPKASSIHVSLPSLAVVRCLIVLAATVSFLAYRLQLQGEIPEWYESTNPAANEKSFFVRATTYAYLHWFHFALLLIPNRFCPDWRNEIPVVSSFADVRAAYALAFYAALLATIAVGIRFLATHRERAGKVLTMSLAWLMLPFIPASNVLFPVGFVVAERVVYSPSVGFCFLAALLFTACAHAVSRAFLCWGVLAAVLAAYSHVLMQRDAEWGNEELLWKAATLSCPHNYVSHVLLGNVYDRQERVDDAIAAFKEALKHHEYYMHANMNLGRMYREKKGDSLTALSYLEKAFMSADEPAMQGHVLYALGLCSLDLQRYDDAIKYFHAATQAVPGNPTYAHYLQQAQQLAKQMPRTRTSAETVETRESTADQATQQQQRRTRRTRRRRRRQRQTNTGESDPDARVANGEHATSASNAGGNNASSSNNSDGQAHEQQVTGSDHDGQDGNAMSDVPAHHEEQPMAEEGQTPPRPQQKDHHYHHHHRQQQQQQHDDAEVKAAKEKQQGRGGAKVQQERPTQEEQFDSSVVGTDTADPVALFNLGVSHAHKSKFEEALTYFKLAGEKSPTLLADTLHKRGVIQLQLQRPQEAVQLLQAAVAAAPARPDIAFDLAITHAQTCNIDAAVEGLSSLEASDASNPKFPYERGTILFQAARPNEAKQAYLTAVECSNMDEDARRFKAKALVNLGVMSFQEGEAEQALALFQRAQTFDPAHTTAQKNAQAMQTLLAQQQQQQQQQREEQQQQQREEQGAKQGAK
ncbi:hypothetical protein PTSG_06255 [Salpingoeca rosetta]|uniref:dolichyl-phosphate-mannose--protein mannosyltransferase n=1 Tax=Salpingoeca rosetta (strain ATCC 50818 / BSB-021) TaxID=946362 RepID=F2UCD8_SALR5|nr:uncharacterized protein PTSG_06255 [Salpingoeca rosetta]EGD74245.1 hypothetical protein PTSG_06255 [Salpingoeca rosetta]|eukprot:XP_004993145.1 hypothetical protein PTSG_06255 [Salpingoeca rosetta]